MGKSEDDWIVNCPLVAQSKMVHFMVDQREVKVSAHKGEMLVWISVAKRDLRGSINWNQRSSKILPEAFIIPALLDTGCTESLVVHDWHLENWLNLPVNLFDAAGAWKYLHGHKCPIIKVDFWLHRQSSTSQAPPTETSAALKLQTSGGAMVSVLRTSRAFPVLERQVKLKRFSLRRIWNKLSAKTREANSIAPYLAALEAEQNKRTPKHQPDDIPPDVFPRLPLVGIKTIHTNQLQLFVDGMNGTFSLRNAAAR